MGGSCSSPRSLVRCMCRMLANVHMLNSLPAEAAALGSYVGSTTCHHIVKSQS